MSKDREDSNKITVIPCVKISGQGITFYNRIEGNRSKRQNDNPKDSGTIISDSTENQIKPEPLPRPEILDSRTVSALKNSIYALLWLSDCNTFMDDYVITRTYKKVSFITLTMPSAQRHPDTVIKDKILGQWLTEMRRDFDNFLYVWRSEKQKNGSIHFHVLINKFYSSHELQKQWNRILDKFSYVTSFSDKFSSMDFEAYKSYMRRYGLYDQKKLQVSYAKGTQSGWRNPPSTQIKSLHSVGNISGYISKEMTKENQIIKDGKTEGTWAFPISGKNWSCSEKLTLKSKWSDVIPDSIYSDLQQLDKVASDKKFTNDYITHYSVSPHLFKKLKLYRLNQFYQDFLFASDK